MFLLYLTCETEAGVVLNTNHVPDEVGEPVENRLDPADKLQMFGFTDSFLNQEEDKTGRHKGHGEDYTDGHQNIHWCGHPEGKQKIKKQKVH